MSIKNFDDNHAIRKEIRRIYAESRADNKVFASVQRLLSLKPKVLAATRTIVTRPGSASPAPAPSKANKVQNSAIQSLTNMLGERHDRKELAEHINYLLKTQFSSEDGAVVKKLTELSDQLVKDTAKLADGADVVLNEQGGKLAPRDFKSTVDNVVESLSSEFDSADIKPKYYVGVDKVTEDGQPSDRLYNMAYLDIKNLKNDSHISDVLVVITRRNETQGPPSNFIRTFTNYVNPSALLKTNIGTKFDSDKRAVDIVLTSLRLDKVIDNIHPTQIPVKKEQVKLANKNITKQIVDVDAGTVTVYLNPDIKTEEAAQKVFQDIFVEVKNLIKVVHPRNRNPVKGSIPKMVKAKYKNKEGQVSTKEQYKFVISFSKPEGGESYDLPRNKVQEMLKILDIQQPDAAQAFNRMLKTFMGVRNDVQIKAKR